LYLAAAVENNGKCPCTVVAAGRGRSFSRVGRKIEATVLGSPNEDSWAEGLQLADFMKHQFPQVIWVPDKFIMPSEVCYSGRF
ncbi:hypothetical protein BHE74_00037002, partial [Ensete ventricosum]